jgi:hypothetical protein
VPDGQPAGAEPVAACPETHSYRQPPLGRLPASTAGWTTELAGRRLDGDFATDPSPRRLRVTTDFRSLRRPRDLRRHRGLGRRPANQRQVARRDVFSGDVVGVAMNILRPPDGLRVQPDGGANRRALRAASGTSPGTRSGKEGRGGLAWRKFVSLINSATGMPRASLGTHIWRWIDRWGGEPVQLIRSTQQPRSTCSAAARHPGLRPPGASSCSIHPALPAGLSGAGNLRD